MQGGPVAARARASGDEAALDLGGAAVDGGDKGGATKRWSQGPPERAKARCVPGLR